MIGTRLISDLTKSLKLYARVQETRAVVLALKAAPLPLLSRFATWKVCECLRCRSHP
jgi:hypothetical protein